MPKLVRIGGLAVVNFSYMLFQTKQIHRYKNGKVDGPVIGPSIGSTWHFNETLESPRYEDYKLEYMYKNRFSYLGMGRTVREINREDMATHLKEPGA